MNEARIWIWIGSILSTVSATWGVMLYKTKSNCKRLNDHDDKISDLEIDVKGISTIISERIPEDFPERLGAIEYQLKQINNK